jgi:PadR family transcriptional regulator, regulatory protein PadR
VIAYYIVRIPMDTPRLSHTAALILKALSLGYRFGLDVMDITGLPSGTVYPALRRLQRDELVTSKWEPEEEAAANQRPARRYYEVTREGKAAARAATERYPLLASLVPEKRS